MALSCYCQYFHTFKEHIPFSETINSDQHQLSNYKLWLALTDTNIHQNWRIVCKHSHHRELKWYQCHIPWLNSRRLPTTPTKSCWPQRLAENHAAHCVWTKNFPSIYGNSDTLFSVPTLREIRSIDELVNKWHLELKRFMKEPKSSQLRRLISVSRIRPTTSHPSKRQTSSRNNFSDYTRQFSKSLYKSSEHSTRAAGRRPKGAHHRRHAMLIPGMIDESEDEMEWRTLHRRKYWKIDPRTAPSWLLYQVLFRGFLILC